MQSLKSATTLKPLPPLPLQRGLGGLDHLSNDSAAHLAETLRLALQAEALDESWAPIIRIALDDFTNAVSRGRWIHGFRAARRARAQWARSRRRGAANDDGSESAILVTIDDEQKLKRARAELSKLANASVTPATTGTPMHMLLTVAPLAPIPPTQDLDFDLVPNNRQCLFANGGFIMPAVNAHIPETAGQILFGLNEWHVDAYEQLERDGNALRLVGGTFSFVGVSSPDIYASLVGVLRIAIYVRLSLLLEQQLLSSLHVPLTFPKVPIPSPPPPPEVIYRPPSPPQTSQSHKRLSSRVVGGLRSAASAGIWSFISRKTEGLLHRPNSRIGYSSDGCSSNRPSHDAYSPRVHMQRLSEDDCGDGTDTVRGLPEQHIGRFGSALQHLEEMGPVLSTSPHTLIPPPTLIVELANREKACAKAGQQKMRLLLTGSERTALEDIRGWDEKDPFAFEQTFSGSQQMTLLYSEHCPKASRIAEPGTDLVIASLTRCGPPRWVTYQFYAPGEDASLGEEIDRLCDVADECCATCDVPRRLHTLTWVHENVKITASMENAGGNTHQGLQIWESCAVCSSRNPAMPVDDAVYLYSFGKFLEQITYSKTLGAIPLSLCSHTSMMGTNDSSIPDRYSILRHVSRDGFIVTFATAPVTDVYEVRVPRLQIVMDKNSRGRDQDAIVADVELEPEQVHLRQEIKQWWTGLREHLQRLDEYFVSEINNRQGKDLPPAPSSEFYETPVLLTESIAAMEASESEISIAKSTTLKSLSSSSVSPSNLRSSSTLLSDLRQSFEKTESDLVDLLMHTPASALNNVRRAFANQARGIVKRLAAWQSKHAPAAVPFDKLKSNEPEWWKAGCYVVPGGRVIVRDGEWGSIISCALSSTDYAEELDNMRAGRLSSSRPELLETRPSTPSAFSSGPSAKMKKNFPDKALPDPDDENSSSAWHDAETISTTACRVDHPRDVSTLLHLRDVLRQNRSADSVTGTSISSRFSSLGSSASRFISSISTPPSAWAKLPTSEPLRDASVPVDVHREENGLLHDVEQQLIINAGASNPGPSISGLNFVNLAQTPPPTTPASSIESELHNHWHEREESTATIKPPVPPKDGTSSQVSTPASEYSEVDAMSARNPSSSINSSLTTTLANAMRFMLNAGTSGDASTKHTSSGQAFEDDDSQPHIKYTLALNGKYKFSCTVYYAQQFEELRRRCGIDEDMIFSLSRTAGWAAAGGKSKANFWKTADDRFIIKSLVNAWNVADLQVLNETAPAYFAYIDSTVGRASVLAKLLGYYTVEIKNAETGAVQSKADLLVMENLFYDQSISKTFDLKGIHGRKAKAKSKDKDKDERQTLFDGEWIEGQQRALVLLRSYSKRVLQDGLRADVDFLSRCNIMDYSLLLGIDEDRKEIVCGLVDTIGSYSFAKTLEYKAKQGLNNNLIVGNNKEVTVMPPAAYRDRFMKAVESYFLACPSKWTKTCEVSTPLYSIV